MPRPLPKFLIVARREFLAGIRTKWFLFATFGLPLLAGAILFLSVFLARSQNDRQRLIVVVDETGAIHEGLVAQFPEKFPDGKRKIEIETANINRLAPAETILAQLHERAMKRDIDGYLHIPKEFITKGGASYYALTVSNFLLNQRIESALTATLRERRMAQMGLEPAKFARLMAPARIETLRVSEAGSAEDKMQTFFLVYILVLVLYAAVMSYGVAICRSIVEEKTSRIFEIMLASVRPFDLLAGKVLGVGLLGLCQTAVWSLIGISTMSLRGSLLRQMGEEASAISMPAFPLWLLPHFLIWFLLGYFLFAHLYALVASLAGSEQEAQQLQLPLAMLLILPLVSQMAIIQRPDSAYAVTLSMIPFFAPIVMFMRTAVLTPSGGQIALSMGLTLATILIEIWVVSRIYRIGILSYGKRPSIRELMRWIFSY